MLTHTWGRAGEDPGWVPRFRPGLQCGRHFDAVLADADIAVRAQEILARRLLNLDDAEHETATARLNALSPARRNRRPVPRRARTPQLAGRPLLTSDAITDWNQVLEHSGL